LKIDIVSLTHGTTTTCDVAVFFKLKQIKNKISQIGTWHDYDVTRDKLLFF